jgi:hypothetical protein
MKPNKINTASATYNAHMLIVYIYRFFSLVFLITEFFDPGRRQLAPFWNESRRRKTHPIFCFLPSLCSSNEDFGRTNKHLVQTLDELSKMEIASKIGIVADGWRS